MTPLRVLTICHNHPGLHPGGSEIFAHDLFRALGRNREVEALFLGCTHSVHRERKPGTAFQTFGRSADELLLWAGHFDPFHMSQLDHQGVMPELGELLTSFQPDIVHLHHLLLIGAESLFLIRRLLPHCRIVLTLHDYYLICANDGQMVKPGTMELCNGAHHDACHGCFPDRPLDSFRLRELHLKGLLSHVDHFVAPSRFLRDRFIAWGIAPSRISVIRNGIPAARPAPHRSGKEKRVFGYFGNINPYKGLPVLLDAMRQLSDLEPELIVHGDALFQTEAFKAEIDAKIQGGALKGVATRGRYDRADLPRLMAEVDWVVVPSVWWENSPLVIQEAFQHRRPVIASDLGGMAETVTHQTSGLTFRAGDSASLARAMRRAMTEPRLWERLVEGIPPTRDIEMAAAEHLALYTELPDAKRRDETMRARA